MNQIFKVGVAIVIVLLMLCGYWYARPHQVPHFVRGWLPGLEMPSPRSPVSNFRAPQF
jgi:hypothetical protein